MENQNNQAPNAFSVNQAPDGLNVPVGIDPNTTQDGFPLENPPKPSKGKTVAIALTASVLGIAVIAGAVFLLKTVLDKTSKPSQQSSVKDCTDSASTDCKATASDSEKTDCTDDSTSADCVTDSTASVTTSDGSTLGSKTVTITIDGKTLTYSGAYVIDGIEATIENGDFASTTDDQNVFLVTGGGKLTIKNATITKTGSENFSGRGDNYSFYGLNSAVVVVGEGSTATLDNVTLSTSVSGANAIVATNKGSATVNNSKIATTKDNSRGLHATYEGVITSDGTEISTLGGSCASLATDRGAGTVTATNMKLSTAGAGSPLIYSTGTITVDSSTGTSTGAQIAVVEGKNSITIKNSTFSANGIGNRNGVDNAGVMIYQSMSGDASVGTGNFTAENSTFTVLEASSVYAQTPFFFVTNTSAVITLTGVTANFSPSQNFLSVKGTSEWGRSGSNGGTVTYTGTNVTATNTTVEKDNLSSVTGLE